MERDIFRVIKKEQFNNDVFNVICEFVAVYIVSFSVFKMWLSVFPYTITNLGSGMNSNTIIVHLLLTLVAFTVVFIPTMNRFDKYRVVTGMIVSCGIVFVCMGILTVSKVSIDQLKLIFNYCIIIYERVCEDFYYTIDTDGISGETYNILFCMVVFIIAVMLSIIIRIKKGILLSVVIMVVPVIMVAETGKYPKPLNVWMVISSGLIFLAVYANSNNKLSSCTLAQVTGICVLLSLAGVISGNRIDKITYEHDGFYYSVRDSFVNMEFSAILEHLNFKGFGGSKKAGNVIGLTEGKLSECGERKITGKKCMTVFLNDKPIEDLYLKGYVGGDYIGSSWDEPDVFRYNMDIMGRKDSFDRVVLGYRKKLKSENKNTVTIRMEKSLNNYFFTPYFLDEKISETIRFYDISCIGKGGQFSNFKKVNKGEFMPYFCEEIDSTIGMSGRLNYNQTIKRLGKKEEFNEYSLNFIPFDTAKSVLVEKDGWLNEAEGGDEYLSNLRSAYTLLGDLYQNDSGVEFEWYDIEETGKKIDDYFANGFEYTLNPGKYNYDVDGDFIEHFEQTKKGYCVHFATVATMMYRSAYIPARYVEGFRIPKEAFVKDSNGFYRVKVTDAMAHAWTEVFDERYGWVPKEHTLGYDSSINNDVEPKTEEPTTENETKAQPETTTASVAETTVNVTETVSTFNKNKGSHDIPMNKFGKIILFIFALGGILYLQLLVRRQYKRRIMKNAAKNTRIRLLYRDIYRICKIKGLKPGGKMDKDINKSMTDMFVDSLMTEKMWDDMISCGYKATYSNEICEKNDYQTVHEFYRLFREEQLKDLPLLKRIWVILIYAI
ncbi:MAG: transglutaminase-like domain-containing protein [Lachnospiraceae bacterium]|nr:transglutaminase-like domain-containing protein [Lachnospiraceae bacterium]